MFDNRTKDVPATSAEPNPKPIPTVVNGGIISAIAIATPTIISGIAVSMAKPPAIRKHYCI